MLQQSTLPQVLTGAQSTSLPQALLGQPALAPRWPRVGALLPLPTTFWAFLLYIVAVAGLAGIMSLHIMLSAQMMERQQELQLLRVEHVVLQRQNADLLWKLNQETGLADVYTRAVQLGYQPIASRQFVLGDHSIVDTLDDEQTAMNN